MAFFRRRPRDSEDETQPLPPVDPTVVDETEPLVPLEETRPLAPVGEGAVREEVVEEEPVYERPPPDRQLWPYLLVLLLLVLGGLGALAYFSQDEERKPVPGVVGQPVDDALNRLSEEGFESRVEQRANPAPQGSVFDQRPGAGVEAEEGSTVTVLVSRGPAQVTVPNVVGLALENALDRLDRAGLGARQRRVFSEQRPGTVVAQDPAGGAKVGRGSQVHINLSKGTGRVDVPNVIGQTADDAGANIRKVGLVARAVEVPSAQPAGTVVAQSPRGGVEAARGDTVRINVSDGSGGGTTTAPTTGTTPTGTTPTGTTPTGTTPTATTPTATTPTGTAPAGTAPTGTTAAPRVSVPDTVGLPVASAEDRLVRAGFVVRVAYVPSRDPAGTVVAQNPTAATRAARGASVRLNVSRGPGTSQQVVVPDVLGLDEASATAELRSAGFRARVLPEATSDPAEEGVVVRQEPAGGQRAPRGAQVAVYVGDVA